MRHAHRAATSLDHGTLSQVQRAILAYLLEHAGGASEPVEWAPCAAQWPRSASGYVSRELADLEARGLVRRLASDYGPFRGRCGAVELTESGATVIQLGRVMTAG